MDSIEREVIRRDRRTIVLYCVGFLMIVSIIFQLFYPTNQLLPFTSVDGVSLGGWDKTEASNQLNKLYFNKHLSIYFGQSDKVYLSPLPSQIGLNIDNTARLNQLDYPWYLRIVPLSILWADLLNTQAQEPTYQRNNDLMAAYVLKNLGDNCQLPAINSGFKVVKKTVSIITSRNGIACQSIDVKTALIEAKLSLESNNSVRIAAVETAPTITSDAVSGLYEQLNKVIDDGIVVNSDLSSVKIPARAVYYLMDLTVNNGQLTYKLNESRATSYLSKIYTTLLASDTKSIIASGTSAVTTQSNISDRQIDSVTTLNNIQAFINGASQTVNIATTLIPVPVFDGNLDKIIDDDDFSLMIQQYAQSHSGTYGVSLMELSDGGRRAAYNDTTQFTTASTYKLFVAYSTLKLVESGAWNWSDQILDDQDLSACFDNMIINSDNDCASTLLFSIGQQQVTDDAVSIGCINTTFVDSDEIKTTAADLALLLAKLQTGQILNQQSSRDVLIDAMKQNVYREGIPAGIGNSVVADKVGFLYELLHDAAIVYSPTGTYVLVILTDQSSWSTIADFANQIEQYRTN